MPSPPPLLHSVYVWRWGKNGAWRIIYFIFFKNAFGVGEGREREEQSVISFRCPSILSGHSFFTALRFFKTILNLGNSVYIFINVSATLSSIELGVLYVYYSVSLYLLYSHYFTSSVLWCQWTFSIFIKCYLVNDFFMHNVFDKIRLKYVFPQILVLASSSTLKIIILTSSFIFYFWYG